jgi:hypothetical protein
VKTTFAVFVLFLFCLAGLPAGWSQEFQPIHLDATLKDHTYPVLDQPHYLAPVNQTSLTRVPYAPVPHEATWLKIRVDIVSVPPTVNLTNVDDASFEIWILNSEFERVDQITSGDLYSDGMEERYLPISPPTANSTVPREREQFAIYVVPSESAEGVKIRVNVFSLATNSRPETPSGAFNLQLVDAPLVEDLSMTMEQQRIRQAAIRKWSTGIARITRENMAISLLDDKPLSAHGYCSGFLVETNLHVDRTKFLVTNYHCISTARQCLSSVFQFHYRREESGKFRNPLSAVCRDFAYRNRLLDLVIIQLEFDQSASSAMNDLYQFKFERARRRRSADSCELGLGGPSLMLLQHPSGRSQYIDKSEECAIRVAGYEDGLTQRPEDAALVGDRDLVHGCDTDEGSSGSPLLKYIPEIANDLLPSVIGVHYFGNHSSTIGMNCEASSEYNRAISANAILNCIESDSGILHLERTRDDRIRAKLKSGFPYCG